MKKPGLSKTRIKNILIASSLIFLISAAAVAVSLPERYRKWLEEEVVYLITPKEREVFLKLQTDRERDIFIEAFWKQRDPNPNTPQNEFREEHYRRLNYANQYLGRGTGKSGWKTDQGRIYIILGPPNNIETYENIMGVYPTQVWFYYGDPRYGLPTGFNVIFFKKEGTGEYILYSPSDHGPQALVADYMYNAKDARDAYQRLHQLSPNLAEQSLSLIPSERLEPGVINLASNRLLATIMSLPQRMVEDAYAEAWFRHKDMIEVEYSTNYIRSDGEVWAVRSQQGHYLIHYAVEPAKLSVSQDGRNYLVRIELNGRISDSQGRTIYQFDKSLPLDLKPEELAEIQKRSISFQDVFPLVPGNYTFDLLLKNPISREFSSFSRKLNLPAETGEPEISQILLAYGLLESQDRPGLQPYQVGRQQLLSRSHKSFAVSDTLVACLQVSGLSEELKKKASLKISLLADNQAVQVRDRSLAELPDGSFVVESLPLSSCKPGYYTLRADLTIGGQVRDSRRAELEVSGLSAIASPILASRGQLTEADELLATGIQSLNTGNNQEALKRLSQAYSLNPGPDSALALAEAFFRSGQFQGVVDLLAPYDHPDSAAELVSLLGRAFHSLNQPARAAVYYEQYLNRFGVNLEILNYLGSCYYQMGDKEKALAIWEKSLSLNPDQEKLKELVNSLKKK
ncbi:MAG: GWxTD domain-containing protein [Candidatus Aminicenantes bacterium]|nr:GWxTD domain-containing protein [Candidatus Aminicenantes bacterium]